MLPSNTIEKYLAEVVMMSKEKIKRYLLVTNIFISFIIPEENGKRNFFPLA
jgi:hypothetical protein